MSDVVVDPGIAAVADAQRKRHRAEGRIQTETLLRDAGHQVTIKTLRAAEGGLEACVIPLRAGTYRFVCDDAPTPDEPDEVAALASPTQFRVSFRLAHELAHTALGGRMGFASRHGSGPASKAEARCDGFAVLFLVDRTEARRAVIESDVAVRTLAQELNVPPNLVHLAASAAS